MRSTSGSRRFHEPRGWTVVPRPCSTRTSPRSSRSFNPSRTTVRLNPNSSHSAGSVGRTSPSASAPPMICWASSWTMTEANRAGRNLPLPRGRRSVCSIPIILWSDQVDTLARVTYYHHMTTFAPRSTLGLGTGPLAGLFEAVSADRARATIDRAWEAGVRYFDTAPLYGSGLAEERLGTALAARPRDEYTISTKVGRVLGPGDPSPHFVDAPPLGAVFDYTPDGIRRSLAGSLERLGLERVDVVLLHDPEEHMDETRRAADAVRGLAHWVGVGTNIAATAAELVARGEVDVVLLAGRYTLLDRSAE